MASSNFCFKIYIFFAKPRNANGGYSAKTNEFIWKGTAGTGKSHVINAICNLLNPDEFFVAEPSNGNCP
jgi:hypothetical protein